MAKVLSVFLICITLTATLCTSAIARSWEPLEAVSEIASWFRKLTKDFDELVMTEKRSQILRASDRLRKGLYKLETDTQFLLDSIPDQKPSKDQWNQLYNYVGELTRSVRNLSKSLSEVGAELRLTSRAEQMGMELKQIDEILSYGLRSRKRTLSYMQEQLIAARGTAPWKPEPIRERLRNALVAVKEAQLAITEFQSRLMKEKAT